MENVEHLLLLSDEYQVTEQIFKPCVKFLDEEPKTKENVMKILALAELYNLEKVRQDCDDLLDHVYYRWTRSTYRATVDRYIGRLSVDYRSTIDRLSTDYRPTIGR